jgi:cytochrome c-type biogenesis protein
MFNMGCTNRLKQTVGTSLIVGGIAFILLTVLVYPRYDGIVAQELKAAPPYRATTLDGTAISLEDVRGEVVLLNVWATWCVPCREEMPGLQALYEEFSNQGFKVVGVSIDDRRADRRISGFLNNVGVTYPIWLDPDNRFAPTFRTIGVPESFLINKEGYIVYQWKGAFDPTSATTKQIVQNTLTPASITTDSGGAAIQAPGGPAAIQTEPVSTGLAFSAGLLSFLSPCVLPLIPSYVAFITGMSMEQLTSSSSSSGQQTRSISRNIIFARGGLFVIGFSTVFVALGATISAAGFFFGDYTVWISRIGGVILIAFGLHLLGLLRIPGVERDYLKMKFGKKPVGHIGAFVIGMGFGAGWTPCIGPILASILTLAASISSVSQGTLLLVIYSAGLAIPFMIATLALDKFLKGFQKFRRWLPWVNRASGILLIGLGIILLTGALTLLSGTLGTIGFDIPLPGV